MGSESVENKELEEIKKSINVLKGKVATLESKKKEIEKEAEELVGQTIYERKKEIERSYGEVLKEAEQRLKTTEKEKQEERKKNIDNLVHQSTRTVKENNTYLKNQIKNIIKENKLPFFVDSDFYMCLWNPSDTKEKVIGIVAMILTLIIPTIIISASKENLIKAFPNTVFRYLIIILIYFGVIFIVGGVWLLVDKLTKKNVDALKEIKEIRKNISDNNKEIIKITKEVNKEAVDEKFDYTKLDRAIEAGKIEVENYRKRKEDAINNFESHTVEDIKERAKIEVEKKTKTIVNEIEKVKEEISELQKKYDELKLDLLDNA